MVEISVLHDRTYYRIDMMPGDTWGDIFDKITHKIFPMYLKSERTGHYNHDIFSIMYNDKQTGTQMFATCETQTNPYYVIEKTKSLIVHIRGTPAYSCSHFIIKRNKCFCCRREKEEDEEFVQSRLCGHELVCTKCADTIVKYGIHFCPQCEIEKNNVKLEFVHSSGKCFKCSTFTHTSHCQL